MKKICIVFVTTILLVSGCGVEDFDKAINDAYDNLDISTQVEQMINDALDKLQINLDELADTIGVDIPEFESY